MDPYFYLYDIRDGEHPYPAALHFKSPHFQKHLSHFIEKYFHTTVVANSSSHGETGHKPSSQSQEYFNLPAVDVRSTNTHYYFDIDLPGVTDKGSINVHWISSHVFVVEGDIPRPLIATQSQPNGTANVDVEPENNNLVRCPGSGESGLEKRHTNSDADQVWTKPGNGNVPLDSAALAQKQRSSSSTFRPNLNDGQPQIIHGERSIGSYRRSFSVPCDADADIQGTEASLEAGVLTIRVPRSEPRKEATLLKVQVV